MAEFDLLSAVQPSDGWYAIVGINGKTGVRQEFAETREDADSIIQKFMTQGRDVYFGVAKYKENGKRNKANVQALRALWVDLDCGEDKPYANQAEALTALRKFCAESGLQRPVLVNSGRGIHAYWVLDREVDRGEWEGLAKALRKVCDAHELYADPACFEAARILRVPGTFNYKVDPPLPVSVMAPSQPVSLEELRDCLGVSPSLPAAFEGVDTQPLTSMARAVMDNNFEFQFSRILKRKDNCRQLVWLYKNRADLTYDQWFAGLTVANRCVDRDEAIHKMSEGYPDYDPEETERTARSSEAPARCSTLESVNPGGCKGCPHLNKIKSPIVLGRALVESEATTVEGTTTEGTAQQYDIPNMPFPYKRGAQGGIYKAGDSDAGEDDIKLLDEDLFVVKRVFDRKVGEEVELRLHTPRDGVRHFLVPYAAIGDHQQLRKTLAFEGILINPKAFPFVADYIMRAANVLRRTQDVEMVREQFGWSEDFKSFFIGTRELTAQGERFAPVAEGLKRYAANLGTKGDFRKWQEVMDVLGTTEGMEGHAFSVLCALGSTLIHMTGQSGVIVNLVNSRSAQGKTTVLRLAASFWGDPVPGKDHIVAGPEDTYMARIHKAGILNSICPGFDECTNMSPKEVSSFAYLIPYGSGRDRLKGPSNELRENDTTWQTIALCSANSSFYEALDMHRPGGTEGEKMRVFEYHVPNKKTVPTDVANQLFDHQLKENYGFAGPRFVQYVLENYDAVKTMALATQKEIDTQLERLPRERIWSALLACVFTAGEISKTLGLINWDLQPIMRWATKHFLHLRAELAPAADSDLDILTDFINRNAACILAVESAADGRSGFTAVPRMEPRGELKIRIEPDTKKIYISVKALRRDFGPQGISFKEFKDDLVKRGVCEPKAKTVRLSTGMKADLGSVYCLVFDAAHPDFNIDLDSFEDEAVAVADSSS